MISVMPIFQRLPWEAGTYFRPVSGGRGRQAGAAVRLFGNGGNARMAVALGWEVVAAAGRLKGGNGFQGLAPMAATQAEQLAARRTGGCANAIAQAAAAGG